VAGRRARYVILLTLGLLVVATVVGLAIAQDQETLQLRSSLSADDPRSAEYLAALVGGDLTRGNVYNVLTNGEQIYSAMLDAIDAARSRISLETYVYEDGKIAEAFTSALEKAARRAVQVNIVVDLFGAAGMADAHVERLRAAGCRLVTLNTPRWYELEEVNYRTHRKILVIDGQVGFTGGVGVADYWLGNAESKSGWRDTHVRMVGPIVRSVEAAFYENFAEAGGTVTPVLDDGEIQAEADVPSLALWSVPTGGSNAMKRLYLLAIAMARRSIDIASPYLITDESTMWAFEDAVARGVRVRLLTESDLTDAKPVKYASRDAYEHLLSLGVELYEYLPTMMHAKVMIVDGVWSMFGSANFDNRSLELNDELNIAAQSRELAARFVRDFEHDLQASRRLDLDEWRRRGVLEKARERFWSYFGEVF
jgi:cardiolipin synthase